MTPSEKPIWASTDETAQFQISVPMVFPPVTKAAVPLNGRQPKPLYKFTLQ